jgi:hypothetical protein
MEKRKKILNQTFCRTNKLKHELQKTLPIMVNLAFGTYIVSSWIRIQGPN